MARGSVAKSSTARLSTPLYSFQPRYGPVRQMTARSIAEFLDRDTQTVLRVLGSLDGRPLRAVDLPLMTDCGGTRLSSPERTRELAHMGTYLPFSRWAELAGDYS